MVMRVDKVNNVLFGSSKYVTQPDSKASDEIKIYELPKSAPDFSVKIPQKYYSLGVQELENGLKIYSYKLANGHKVTIIPMEDSPTTVKNYVNVGSMNETDDIKGISHFLEHMAFNGTNGTEGYIKLNRGDSFKKIDELGGWSNASTNYSLTDYVNSTPLLDDDDLEKQIQVIAAMTEDLELSSDMVEKEKFPVCSEIDMILDSPETVAIDQTVRSLFNIKSSADELVGGSVQHIQNLDRQKVLDYYNKYYTPDNMHLVITGDIEPEKTMEIVSKNFHSKKLPAGKRLDKKLIPISQTVRKDFITDKASSANIIIGFAGPSSNNVKDYIISEILEKYISSTEVGLNDELKKRSAFSYAGLEKISTNPNNPTFLYYQIECSEENTEEILKLYFDKFSNIKIPNKETLDNIKESLIMQFENSLEYSMAVNNLAGKSAFDGNLGYLTNYRDVIENISISDIEEYIGKYLDMSKVAITVVHPDVPKDTIISNYHKAKNLSFCGSSKRPVDSGKVSEFELNNNYRIAFSDSKYGNVPFMLDLRYELPKDINPALIYVLNSVYAKGTENRTEKDFLKYQEQNNLSVNVSIGKDCLNINGYSSASNFEKTAVLARELLYFPRITQESVDEAIAQVKERLSRYDNSSRDLYEAYESVNNPYYDSVAKVIEGLDEITLEDVRNLHNYIINNSKGIITVNIPEKYQNIKDEAIKSFSEYKEAEPYFYEQEKIYKDNKTPVVLAETRNVSQADISQTYKFKTDNSIKDKVTGELLNLILSSSNSIGLFNSLRECEHLAYRVGSTINTKGDVGEISLRILTSTDNKETGLTSYDNLQKSINGFNRQLTKLLNSEYDDYDLEIAKRSLKARILNKESVYSRLNSINYAQYLDESLDYENKVFDMIDSITRADIDNMSKRIFNTSPIYSIVASEDTINYNKEFLNNLTK